MIVVWRAEEDILNKFSQNWKKMVTVFELLSFVTPSTIWLARVQKRRATAGMGFPDCKPRLLDREVGVC